MAISGAVFGLLVVAMGATPALAAEVSPFFGAYKETTTPLACPTTPTHFCYQGAGTGPTFPPGDLHGIERFTGYVDEASVNPATHCAPDFNVVTITTRAGTLNVTTQGSACPDPRFPNDPSRSVDTGVWQAHGGTGIFVGATGSGTVSTVGQFLPNGTITSFSVYQGTLTLQHGD